MTTERPPDEPSDQVKKDIEDILTRMGEDDDDREQLRVAATRKPRVVKPRGRGMQPGTLMGLGAVLLVLSIFVAPLRLGLAIGGILLLGYGYYISWRSGRSRPVVRRRGSRGDGSDVRYWRGQRIEYGPNEQKPEHGNIVEFRETWMSRLRRWWRNRQR